MLVKFDPGLFIHAAPEVEDTSHPPADELLEPREDREPRLHTRSFKHSEHFKSKATKQTSESALIALALSFKVPGGFCVVARPDSTCRHVCMTSHGVLTCTFTKLLRWSRERKGRTFLTLRLWQHICCFAC